MTESDLSNESGDRPQMLSSLENPLFRRLYLAQSISLFGDAFTWLGLALVSYQFGPDRVSTVLASALTLRVTAYILFSPFAGVLADRVNRKLLLCVTLAVRMVIVACLPLVSAEWQLYTLVFLLNVFSGIFTPVYRAIVPNVVSQEEYRAAVGLSNATFQVLGILGPGAAGVFSGWLGVREIFLLDAISFVIAGVLISSLPRELGQTESPPSETEGSALNPWREAVQGLRLLLGNSYLRFSLAIEFLSAIAGAQILVNTIGYVKSVLGQGDQEYGLAMSALALGAACSALASGADRSVSRRGSLTGGILLLGFTVASASSASYPVLIVLWLFAGLGQTLAEIPSETLIGENIPVRQQGKVYGAHFALSHFWWALAYPLAGALGQNSLELAFLASGVFVVALGLLFSAIAHVSSRRRSPETLGQEE